MTNLHGKVALVTGSTKGIGHAIAAELVGADARVIIHGRHMEQVRHVGDELRAYGGVTGDLGKAEGCEEVMQQLAHLDPVEILINNAGIFSVEDFFQISDDEWLRYFQINVLSAVRLCRSLIPHMLKIGSGRVINVASEAGV